jgi:hypothetical protein
VTVSPAKIVAERFNVIEDPETDTEETEIFPLPPPKRERDTVKAEVAAVVAESASL